MCLSLLREILPFPYLPHSQTSSAVPLQPPQHSGEQNSMSCNSSSGNSISSRCDRKHKWQVFYLSELIHHSSIIFRFTTSCQDKAKFPFSLRFKWKSLSIFWLASIQVPEDKCYIFDYLIPKFWKMQNKVDLLSHNALLAALRLAAQH